MTIVMATPVLHFALFQLFLLWRLLSVEGANSTVIFSNVTNPTASNGIGNHLMPRNITKTSSGGGTVNSTNEPPVEEPAEVTENQGIRANVSSASSPELPMGGVSGGLVIGPNGTEPTVNGVKNEDKDDVPFWAYIMIAVGVILLVTAVVVIFYARGNRWKNHGSYMVWDDNELDLSPAFTRESEFLLDNLAADHEPGTPELQIYEIPLESLGFHRVYIGTKKVAPKTDEHRQVVKFTRPKKQRWKDKHEFQGNTLPRTGRRDHIYSSVNNEVTNTLSEGDLHQGRNINGLTLPTALSSSQNLCELDASKLRLNESLSPEDSVPDLKTSTLGSRTKSVSNLFQNRPLPPAPSKRFSKSLDRLRFFEAVPHIKGKGKTFPYHLKSSSLQAHPVLVKSSSFGGTFNRIVARTQPPLPPTPRKGSVDILDKSATFDMGHARKSNLCHRHSKSLDTLLLLKDINWTAYGVDIYHSYESVRSGQSDNNNEKEPSYVSVSGDEESSSHGESSGRVNSQIKASTRLGSEGPADDLTGENLYASVSDDEISKLGGSDSRRSKCENDNRDSGVSSSIAGSEDPSSPYASVRISQIPGLVMRPSLGEESNFSEDGFEKEDSGSSIGTCKDLRDNEDLKRASTHTYLQLLTDSGRDSVISETSSGYARPVDVISEKSDQGNQGTFSGEYPSKSSTDPDIAKGEEVGRALDEIPASEEYSSGKREKIPLVSDNSPRVEEEGTSTPVNAIRVKARMSQVFSETVEGDDDLQPSTPQTEVHIYENTGFVQNLHNRDAAEQVRTTTKGIPVV